MPKSIDEFDWSSTPLGARDSWPLALKTTYDIMMGTEFATCATWGPEQTLIYNAAYIPFLGARHPGALGRPIHEVWADVWADIAPLLDKAMAGERVYMENMHLVMTRNGFPEDTYWTFSYSPVKDGDRVEGILDIAIETTQQVLAERGRALLMAETTHRLKNTLALVQAIAQQTLRRGRDKELVQTFEERLHALAAAHDVLLEQDWSGADLGGLIEIALSRVADRTRFTVEGAHLRVKAPIAQNVSLIIHELTTNAIKHGALSRPEGHVTVRWARDGGRVTVEWRERGGPPATPPTRKGFGTRLVGLGLTGAGGVETDYAPEGLTVRLSAAAEALLDA
ncbi:sensor histidine kinase [uncultured Caulobacter sp.]|uniref:sensor histidine kinase n=2 Tax=Pseudomonadota TaxID=1224 RepID=UPI002633ACA2|nr:sensor histidine kinase [uncultured Caulobacter sp.]